MTASTMIGTRLGAYEVQSVLGIGGMATVYRGFDHNLQRLVAIKILSADASAQPDFADRFRQEARMVARLRHPNIVHVYDFGTLDQIVYMVQELLPGQTLAERLAELAARNQPMPRREIIAVIQQLAAALDVAHAAGIIHRDVKPSNALYNADAALVLTDFGIAKSAATDATKTQTGMVLGTPTYISPEQARAETLTPASDIYALGVVLYELISGRPPFDDGTPLGIVLKHLHEPPPPLQPLRPSVTPQVEAVVQRALAKRPEDRFSTATSLAQALAAAWPEQMPAAPAGSVHNLPTVAWQPATPAASTPAVEPIAAARISLSSAPMVGATPSAHTPATQSRKSSLPLLALLLVGLLLAGMVLAWRGDRTAPARAIPTQAAPESATQAAPIAAVPPTVIIEPGATPLAQIRQILGANANPAMNTSLEHAEQALIANDKAGATQALGLLQRQILAARQDGSLSTETMRAALAALQDIAVRHELQLPLEIG